MRTITVSCLLVGLVAGLLPTQGTWAQRAGAPSLGTDGLVVFRDPHAVPVLALATSGWRGVQTPSEALRGDFRYLPEYATDRTRGQVFRVVAARDQGMVGRVGASFVVVPWTFGPGCAEEGWGHSHWVAPGDTVVFLLTPTRVKPEGEGALPVFDVLGWHQPYPVGELIPFWTRRRVDAHGWLSPREYYDFLRRLPTERKMAQAPAEAVAPLLEWLRAESRRMKAFPAWEVLDAWGIAGEAAPVGEGGWEKPAGAGGAAAQKGGRER